MCSNRYVIYLRKSRTDYEAEKRGEGETLARHRKILTDFTNRNHLPVSGVYAEIVSGESIAARPVMQRLLSEVEQNLWDGVIVMELERLARGDTVDQGIVARTFQYSGTKIITPVKTYDPANEFDEEYFEFGLFMSRREYKTINRRLQRGRMAAVMEGKYISAAAPFGYRRVRLTDNSGYTLAADEEQAETVRLIFDLYTGMPPSNKNMPVPHRKNGRSDLPAKNPKKSPGIRAVCRELESMGRKGPSGCPRWSPSTVRDILSNPVYTGKLRWQWRRCVKKMKNGILTVSRPKDRTCLICEGLHPAIISQEIFEKAQAILAAQAKRRPAPPAGQRR